MVVRLSQVKLLFRRTFALHDFYGKCTLMTLSTILEHLEQIAPTHDAESWDNVGLLVGDPAQDVSHAMLTIDYTPQVAIEAERKNCDLVIAYHPPIFEPLKRITAGSLIYDAIRRGVAIYSPHTALDVAEMGTNDMLADVVGMGERRPLRIRPRPDEKSASNIEPTAPGMGRVGPLLRPATRTEVFERIKQQLGLAHLLIAWPQKGIVHRAAVCAGACGNHLNEAIAEKVDLYLTGEMRHHDAIKAVSAGLTVVCTLHSNSERAILRRLKGRLTKEAPEVQFHLSEMDCDPFTVT